MQKQNQSNSQNFNGQLKKTQTVPYYQLTVMYSNVGSLPDLYYTQSDMNPYTLAADFADKSINFRNEIEDDDTWEITDDTPLRFAAQSTLQPDTCYGYVELMPHLITITDNTETEEDNDD